MKEAEEGGGGRDLAVEALEAVDDDHGGLALADEVREGLGPPPYLLVH